MNPAFNTDSGVSSLPVSMTNPAQSKGVASSSTAVPVQPIPNVAFTDNISSNATQPVVPQPVYPQPTMAPVNGVSQANPAMYPMTYQPGTQPVMVPVGYTPQAYGPVNPMPTEVSSDLASLLKWRCCMLVLLIVNYVVSLFIFEGNLVMNIIGSIFFCDYSGWMMIVYAVGNGLSALATAMTAYSFYVLAVVTPELASELMIWFNIYLGLTIFYIVMLITSVLYSIKAVKVSNQYTTVQIANVDRTKAWKKCSVC